VHVDSSALLAKEPLVEGLAQTQNEWRRLLCQLFVVSPQLGADLLGCLNLLNLDRKVLVLESLGCGLLVINEVALRGELLEERSHHQTIELCSCREVGLHEACLELSPKLLAQGLAPHCISEEALENFLSK